MGHIRDHEADVTAHNCLVEKDGEKMILMLGSSPGLGEVKQV